MDDLAFHDHCRRLDVHNLVTIHFEQIFIDYDQVVGAPVKVSQVYAVGVAMVTAQVSVMQQGEAEAVAWKRIQYIVDMGLVNRPILPQLFGTQHKNALIARFEELDNR